MTTSHHDKNELAAGSCPCDHEWVAFSTALNEVCIMVQCVNCGAHGSIDDPSEEEWSEAFHAPSEPYQWHDGSRVRIRGVGPLRVRKAPEREQDGEEPKE